MLDANYVPDAEVITTIEELESAQLSDPDFALVEQFQNELTANKEINNGLGESVLGNLIDFRNEVVNSSKEIQESLKIIDKDPLAAVEVQMSLFKFIMQQEIIAKMSGKFSQGVETLMKAQ